MEVVKLLIVMSFYFLVVKEEVLASVADLEAEEDGVILQEVMRK